MRTKPKFLRCKCGNLIVLAHGDSECASCFMKRIGKWTEDHPWPKKRVSTPLAKFQECE